MSDVIKLVTTPTIAEAAKKQAVELLEEMLADAKAGRIGAFVAVYEKGDEYESVWTGTSDTARRVGMLEIAKFRMHMRIAGE